MAFLLILAQKRGIPMGVINAKTDILALGTEICKIAIMLCVSFHYVSYMVDYIMC